MVQRAPVYPTGKINNLRVDLAAILKILCSPIVHTVRSFIIKIRGGGGGETSSLRCETSYKNGGETSSIGCETSYENGGETICLGCETSYKNGGETSYKNGGETSHINLSIERGGETFFPGGEKSSLGGETS